MMQESPAVCQYYTREPSWEVLMALLAFFNARGAFDHMRQFQSLKTSSKAGAKKKIKTGRPFVMPLLEDRFLIFMLVFTRFRRNMLHVANMFHVCVDTVERIYETWVCAVGIFFTHMMPMPSGEQLVAMTPARISTKLNLEPGTGIVIGDCTETRMEDPGTKHPAQHCAVYSDYKGCTTVKHLTACTGSSYMCFISDAFCGGCTDTQLHEVTNLANLLPKPPGVQALALAAMAAEQSEDSNDED